MWISKKPYRDYLFKSQILIGLIGCIMLFSGVKSLGYNWFDIGGFNWVLVFCACVFIYRIDWFMHKLAVDKCINLLISGKPIEGSVFYPCLLLLYALVMLTFALPVQLLFHLGTIAVLYHFPASLPFQFRTWRRIPYLKVFLIAYVWAMLGSYYPAALLGLPLDKADIFTHFLCWFVYILAITLPFDIRDIHSDQSQNLWTITRAVGAGYTKLIAVLLLVVFTAIAYFVGAYPLGGLLALLLINVGLVLGVNDQRPVYYFKVLMDGMVVVTALFFASYSH
ncbi:hypothetical protein [Persicobacter psychrovividus]|uniref:UbiA prenyltransferase family protein n=1 Tax=Persicobacter psychrovividus TaxID=387638 RepID=A0ABM7VGY3_9BACT|nr:hypothetical protein PEPS_24990 [Persicobacter psychrovividus]